MGIRTTAVKTVYAAFGPAERGAGPLREYAVRATCLDILPPLGYRLSDTRFQ
jgi:hypothetical protein